MKRPLFAALSLLALAGPASAQTADAWYERARLSLDSVNTFTFRWDGRPGRTYFMQTSLDLVSWTYLNEIRSGTGLVIPYGLTSTSDRYFLRLRFSDQYADEPALADFDGDGVGNADELSHGLDPLSALDNDSDGVPDDWERFWFGNLSHDGIGNEGEDGFTNLEEFLFGLNPNADDSVTSVKDISYDALGRLQSAGSVIYTYDAEGNIETTGN